MLGRLRSWRSNGTTEGEPIDLEAVRDQIEDLSTKPRFAVESWFFGPSAFPEGYTALAF